MFLVNEYFLKVDTNLDWDMVINGPVHAKNSAEAIGKIVGYDRLTGFVKIRLFYDVNYKELLPGVPMEHIVFKYTD